MELLDDADQRFRVVFWIVAAIGIFTGIFDVLKKTVFLGASWNYNYPYWNFVYDVPILVFLIAASVAVVVGYPKMLKLSDRQFGVALYLVTVSVFLLALFALPLERTAAFDVHTKGLHSATVYLVNNGPVQFLSDFHALPGSIPEHEELMAGDGGLAGHAGKADRIATIVEGQNWLPFNESLAACISTIIKQKHGPASVFLVAPFVLLFGSDLTGTVLGTFALSALTPVIAYAAYRRLFDERVARTVALLTGFAPALFFFTRQLSPVPYDTFTGLYVAATLALLLRGLEANEVSSLAAAGITLSLAVMTKFTALFFLPTFVGLTYFYLTQKGADPLAIGYSYGTFVAVPTVLFVGGYNTVCQLVFTGIKFFIGSRSNEGAASNLTDPIIAKLTPLYNGRWVGVPLAILAGVYIWRLLMKRSHPEDRDVITSLVLISAIPYLVYFLAGTGTLSRHMIAMLVPLGFVSVRGLELLVKDWGGSLVLIGRLSVALTLASFLINI